MDQSDEETICLPPQFFDQTLSSVQDLAELKSILYVWQVASGTPRGAANLGDLLQLPVARAIAGANSPRPVEDRVQAAVERAVVNGHLLRYRSDTGSTSETWLLPATDANRELLSRVSTGEETAVRALQAQDSAQVSVYRPNVFAVFERSIGPLTPLVADQIRSAEKAYPREWIEQAISLAAAGNHRSWRYIEAVLTRWEERGGPDRG